MSEELARQEADGKRIVDDVIAMVEALERDKAEGPYLIYMPVVCDRRVIRRMARRAGCRFKTYRGSKPRCYYLDR